MEHGWIRYGYCRNKNASTPHQNYFVLNTQRDRMIPFFPSCRFFRVHSSTFNNKCQSETKKYFPFFDSTVLLLSCCCSCLFGIHNNCTACYTQRSVYGGYDGEKALIHFPHFMCCCTFNFDTIQPLLLSCRLIRYYYCCY